MDIDENKSIKEEIAKNITKYRKIQNISQKELAQRINISQSRLSNWETGVNSMDIDSLMNICNVLNVTINDMYGVYPDANINLNYEEQNLITKYRTLDNHSKEIVQYIIDKELDRPETICEDTPPYKVISLYTDSKVSAGYGNALINNPPTDTIKISSIGRCKTADYAVLVSGDSMEPDYTDGDIVLVQATRTIEIGEIGIFFLDGNSYIKKLGKNELISLNKKYQPISIDEDTICLGRIVGKQSDNCL